MSTSSLLRLLTGLRADELINANIGNVRRSDDGSGVLHVCVKGNKDRIPFSRELLDVVEQYLQSRSARFPPARRRSPDTTDDALGAFSPTAPRFVEADGEQITRGTLQYRIMRAFKKAGINGERASGALVHGRRHTFATELANANVSV